MTHLPIPGRGKRWLLVAAGAAVGIAAALRPLVDPDFWWHLKTGAEMARRGGLLTTDPFTFTVGEGISLRVLQGYWPVQLLYHGLYSLAGPAGILALNLGLWLTIYAVLVWLLSRRDLEVGVKALLVLLGMAVFLPYYQLERPQVWSFLCGLLLVALLDRVRDQRQLSGWLFPLMVVWGNVHGGVIFGIAMLGLFLLATLITGRADRPFLARAAGWAMGGIACGFVNPTTAFHLLPELARLFSSQQADLSGIMEFDSTLELFRRQHYWVACLWLLMAIHAAGLLLARRRSLSDVLLFLFLVPSAAAYGRNMAFFAICLLPQTAYYLQGTRLAGGAWVRRAAWVGGVLLAALLLLRVAQRQEYVDAGRIAPSLPLRLVEFVATAGIDGRVYNDYDWGGFLLWSLYPQSKVFIDGRNLDPKVYDHWQRIRWATQFDVRGQPEYLALLDRYGVEYVIQKNISKVGLTEPLLRHLLASDDWLPVYQDDQGYVLVRNLPRYRPVIERYRIDKALFINNLLQLYRHRIEASHDARLYLGRGELYLALNDLAAARSDLQMARQALGDDPYLANLLKKAGL